MKHTGKEVRKEISNEVREDDYNRDDTAYKNKTELGCFHFKKGPEYLTALKSPQVSYILASFVSSFLVYLL